MTATARAAAVLAYLSSVILANWLTTRYGFVPVGFGYTATAGTFAAGGVLVVRDVVQDTIGRAGTARLIIAAALLSYLVATPAIAVASGLAFLTSETLDMLAYTPLRRRAERFGDRRWQAAVTAGAILGAITDSIVFLTVAFGWASVRPALPGQMIGKLEITAAFLIVGAVTGRAVLRQSVQRKGA